MFIDKQDKEVSVRKQCQLLGINRTSLYYKPVEINARDQTLMNLLDEEYTRHPFYGVRRMVEFLRRTGYEVGRDHVRTLLRKLGITAIYPRRNTSKANPEHKIYPYLLGDLEIIRANQVWSADITYLRLEKGFVYLVGIIDWYSRYVLSWRISNTLDADFCIEALKEALSYGKPEIFNTDQGCQFTSQAFIDELIKKEISISMDAKGRVFDNIFVERLWRTVKYENVYLNGYQSIPEVKEGLTKYFNFYNTERFHQALDNKTPWEIYSGLMVKNTEFVLC